MSGTAIAGALERLGHRVTRADISPGDTSALDREGLDLVFIALHGEFGESGEVQRLCQERNLAYTGSPPRASELAMDKAAAKQLFRQASLATPDWNVIEEFHAPELVKAHLKEIPVPVVVKPIDGGSSIGVTIARSEAARDRAVEQALDKYGRVMVEQYVPGRELTVSVLGDDALSVLEVVPAGEFYDYNAKYADDSGTRYVFDHALDAQTVKAVQSAALTAHRCLGCRDMSRVDFILDPSGLLQVLEVNTIPGFTSHSLLPMAAARAGIDFDELVARLVNMAIKRSAVCRNVKQRQNHAR
jgi:D-alanine-D-alanine ligase